MTPTVGEADVIGNVAHQGLLFIERKLDRDRRIVFEVTIISPFNRKSTRPYALLERGPSPRRSPFPIRCWLAYQRCSRGSLALDWTDSPGLEIQLNKVPDIDVTMPQPTRYHHELDGVEVVSFG